VQGEYYLGEERYSEGIPVFKEKLSDDPYDAAANYYMGRYLLALKRPEEAVKYLQEAAELSYYEADYYYWLGNCHNALKDFKAEQASYQRALELNPGHLYARLDLGHSYLEHGRWQQALASYEEVLARNPEQPQALYNKGLALNKLGSRSAEIEAWKAYLKIYPQGRWAIRAVDHLNAGGDFSYRNYSVGHRRIPLEQIGFDGKAVAPTPASKRSLDVIGSVLGINLKINLRIVVHEGSSLKLAHRRAGWIRDYLINNHPVIDPRRLSVDATTRPEKIKSGAKMFALKSSVSIATVEN
jgi:tetratricopeptide (TPR) repeat protein